MLYGEVIAVYCKLHTTQAYINKNVWGRSIHLVLNVVVNVVTTNL
jgi:hypothetical protein